MALTGHCYCGKLRYEAGGTPLMKLMCHCREWRYFTGGNSLPLIVTPEAEFKYTAGEVKKFARTDLAAPVTREFCPSCGTHVVSRSPGMPGAGIVKGGSLDDPSPLLSGCRRQCGSWKYSGGCLVSYVTCF